MLDDDTSEDEALLAFESVDTEGDGYIGFKEFVAWWTG
jgi:Ca2+-binding EF-hand superfamily protein